MYVSSQLVRNSARVVLSVASAMPRHHEIAAELQDAEAAQERGYFLPDEDEHIREVFACYLSLRSSLLEVLGSMDSAFECLLKIDENDEVWENRLRIFVIGFTAATLLIRAATFIVRLGSDRPVVWKKLDEAEPRYGIPKKSYTQVYKNLSSPVRMWRFHEAMTFYHVHKEDISMLREDADMGGLVEVLNQEEAFFECRRLSYLRRSLNYRLHSFKRRHVSGYKKVMFHLFKISGSAIAEMRQPFVKIKGRGKRVTGTVLGSLRPLLRAGDVFITRHDDALSNLFLPGFWPHAALYIGEQSERDALGVSLPSSDGRCLRNFQFLEAKKDGVLFRSMAETLSVDAFMVLRPVLDNYQIAEALNRALTHEGKLYDFMFDFRHADRLACTEVIYRTYHGIGPVSFALQQHGGRTCLSAEDLIEQAIGSGAFKKINQFGID